MKGLQRAVAKGQKPYPHIRLVTLQAFLLQIQGQLRRDDRLDVVGLLQRLHFHIVIQHHQHILQISPSKGAGFHFGKAAGFHVAAQQGLEDNTHSGFALTAFSGDQQHFLTTGGGNQAVTKELLQGGNILRIENSISPQHPTPRQRFMTR